MADVWSHFKIYCVVEVQIISLCNWGIYSNKSVRLWPLKLGARDELASKYSSYSVIAWLARLDTRAGICAYAHAGICACRRGWASIGMLTFPELNLLLTLFRKFNYLCGAVGEAMAFCSCIQYPCSQRRMERVT